MKLTAQELNVIIDTLLGSLRIKDDNLDVFRYPTDNREVLVKDLISRADMVEIGVDTVEST